MDKHKERIINNIINSILFFVRICIFAAGEYFLLKGFVYMLTNWEAGKAITIGFFYIALPVGLLIVYLASGWFGFPKNDWINTPCGAFGPGSRFHKYNGCICTVCGTVNHLYLPVSSESHGNPCNMDSSVKCCNCYGCTNGPAGAWEVITYRCDKCGDLKTEKVEK